MKRSLSVAILCLPFALAHVGAAGELPERAATLVAAFEEDAEAMEFELNRRVGLLRVQGAERLKPIQDEYTRAAKLDEAVAIRELRRQLADAAAGSRDVADLPTEATEVLDGIERDARKLRREAAATIRRQRLELAAGLERFQDESTRAAKLDEAVAIRDTIRALKQGETNAAPDPGTISGLNTQVGQTHVFKVTGSISGSVWGTDVFTSDSRISVAAVHAGVLEDGQTGVVKVTVLPGRPSYGGSTRHGITTYSYGGYSMSYRVDRVFGGLADAGMNE